MVSNVTTAEAREKISAGLEPLDSYKFFDVCVIDANPFWPEVVSTTS